MRASLCMGTLCVMTFYLSTSSQTERNIEVSEASYGLNCQNNAAGNATEVVKTKCDGKVSCSFTVSEAAQTIGDHCPGTPKTFDVTFKCGDDERNAHVTGEAVGKTVYLTCSD